jgi:uncharacterized damage-inducible protein DinB
MEWADAAVWAVVLDSEAARADRGTVKRLRHMQLTQRFFLKLWKGEPIDYADVGGKEAAEVLEGTRRYYDEVLVFLAQVDEATLQEPLEVPWAVHYAREGSVTATRAETLFQVSSHSTYHRGQVNARLRELGAEPPTVDYIVWVWLGRPRAVWPL